MVDRAGPHVGFAREARVIGDGGTGLRRVKPILSKIDTNRWMVSRVMEGFFMICKVRIRE